MRMHKAVSNWGLHYRDSVTQHILPCTHTISVFLSFPGLLTSTKFKLQLILLALHFASDFLFIFALRVTFSSVYFSASLTLFLCLLHMTLGLTSWPSRHRVNLFICSTLCKQHFLVFKSPLKSTHGLEPIIDSKPYSQRLEEIWPCLTVTVRNLVRWHHAAREWFWLVQLCRLAAALSSITVQHLNLLSVIGFLSHIKQMKFSSIKRSPFVFFLEFFSMPAKYSEIQNKYWGDTFPHRAFQQLSYPLGSVSNPVASPSEREGSLTKQKLIHCSEKKIKINQLCVFSPNHRLLWSYEYTGGSCGEFSHKKASVDVNAWKPGGWRGSVPVLLGELREIQQGSSFPSLDWYIKIIKERKVGMHPQ